MKMLRQIVEKHTPERFGASVLCILLALAAAGCSTGGSRITVGTFNIAWLGDGRSDREPRNEEEIQAIAGVIRETDADVLGVQEIENAEAIGRVLKYLPGYSAHIGTLGREQNVGLIYRNSVEVRIVGEYAPVAIEAGRNRPGLAAHCKKGNFDWIMMVVHLKSTSRYDSTEELRQKSYLTRSAQTEKIVKWADSIRRADAEQDVIIAGDFNDFPLRKTNPTLLPALVDSSLKFLTMNMGSCKSDYMKGIDHILVSGSAAARFVAGSDRMINTYAAYPKKQAEKISDHCPVTVQFDISTPDND